MGNEDYFAPDGPGRSFKRAFESAIRRGSLPTNVAQHVVQGIRNHLRRVGGPQHLLALARTLGLVAPGDVPRLPLPTPPIDVRQALEDHKRVGGPTQELEVEVLRLARGMIRNGGRAPSEEDLCRHYCTFLANAMLFSRVHSDVALPTRRERVVHVDTIRAETERLLRGEASDITSSLMADPSGASVRLRFRKPRIETAAIVAEPIEILTPAVLEA